MTILKCDFCNRTENVRRCDVCGHDLCPAHFWASGDGHSFTRLVWPMMPIKVPR